MLWRLSDNIKHFKRRNQLKSIDRIENAITGEYESSVDKITSDTHAKVESGHFPAYPRRRFWWIIGPGLLSGTSGNDPSAITAYAEDGTIVGYGHLWLIFLSTLFYQAVQFACAKIGRITQKELPSLLRTPLANGIDR